MVKETWMWRDLKNTYTQYSQYRNKHIYYKATQQFEMGVRVYARARGRGGVRISFKFPDERKPWMKLAVQ